MRAARGPAVYEAMWGPNEWTVTGALQGWDVRPRLHELRIPTLVIRGGHDLSTPLVSRTLVGGITAAVSPSTTGVLAASLARAWMDRRHA